MTYCDIQWTDANAQKIWRINFNLLTLCKVSYPWNSKLPHSIQWEWQTSLAQCKNIAATASPPWRMKVQACNASYLTYFVLFIVFQPLCIELVACYPGRHRPILCIQNQIIQKRKAKKAITTVQQMQDWVFYMYIQVFVPYQFTYLIILCLYVILLMGVKGLLFRYMWLLFTPHSKTHIKGVCSVHQYA